MIFVNITIIDTECNPSRLSKTKEIPLEPAGFCAKACRQLPDLLCFIQRARQRGSTACEQHQRAVSPSTIATTIAITVASPVARTVVT